MRNFERFSLTIARWPLASTIRRSKPGELHHYLGRNHDQARPRQNVVFEMGFFFGLIGRERVAVLYEPEVELPSDISGLVYTELDAAGGWKPKLASELNRAGIHVDWAKLAQN